MIDADRQWNVLYVDKKTNSSADTVLAGGLAIMIDKLCSHLGWPQSVVLHDAGPHYAIELSKPLPATRLGQLAEYVPFSLISLLVKDKPDKAVVRALAHGQNLDGIGKFYLDDQRRQRDVAYQRRQSLKGMRLPSEAMHNDDRLITVSQDGGVSPEFAPYSAFSAFKVDSSVNDIILCWAKLSAKDLTELIGALLSMFSCTPNEEHVLDGALKPLAKQYGWKKEATQLQIINPIAGKGANVVKSNGVSIGSLDGLWPLELLKLAGYIALSAPMVVQDAKPEGVKASSAKGGEPASSDYKAKDRKTYVLRPSVVEIKVVQEVMSLFRETLRSTTAVRLDVLASLLFTQTLLTFHKERLLAEKEFNDDPDDALGNLDDVAKVAQGFDMTFSKSLGNAVATMNIATIGLPAWLPPATSIEETNRALTLLAEHIKVVRSIGNRSPSKQPEEGAEEHVLLNHYRDFLSGRGDIAPFLRFTTAYGPYILAQRYRKRRAHAFTEDSLTEVFMATKELDLKKIIETPGFRSIADCIRAATITPQYTKSTAGGTPYEIRYGLGQELARASKDDAEFVQALGTFLQSYGAENARQLEILKRRYSGDSPAEGFKRLRHSFSDGDLDELIPLIQQHHSGLICSLLLAYGYARRKRPGETAAQDDADEIDAEAGADDEE